MSQSDPTSPPFLQASPQNEEPMPQDALPPSPLHTLPQVILRRATMEDRDPDALNALLTSDEAGYPISWQCDILHTVDPDCLEPPTHYPSMDAGQLIDPLLVSYSALRPFADTSAGSEESWSYSASDFSTSRFPAREETSSPMSTMFLWSQDPSPLPSPGSPSRPSFPPLQTPGHSRAPSFSSSTSAGTVNTSDGSWTWNLDDLFEPANQFAVAETANDVEELVQHYQTLPLPASGASHVDQHVQRSLTPPVPATLPHPSSSPRLSPVAGAGPSSAASSPIAVPPPSPSSPRSAPMRGAKPRHRCAMPGCAKDFSTKKNAARHQRTAKEHRNLNTSMYECPHCQKKEPRSDLHKRHVTSCGKRRQPGGSRDGSSIG